MNSTTSPPCKTWFITGTDTGIGKTLIASALLYALTQKGLRTAAMKPVAAGAEYREGGWHNDDMACLAEHASLALPTTLSMPYLLREPTAPHIAAAMERRVIALPTILSAYHAITQRADAVVIEGVGGFCVPLNDQHDTADLAQQLNAPVILVVGCRLGCLNHAQLTAQAIAARGLSLAAWVMNTVDEAMLHQEATIDALRSRLEVPYLGCVPRLESVGPARVIEAAGHLALSRLLR